MVGRAAIERRIVENEKEKEKRRRVNFDRRFVSAVGRREATRTRLQPRVTVIENNNNPRDWKVEEKMRMGETVFSGRKFGLCHGLTARQRRVNLARSSFLEIARLSFYGVEGRNGKKRFVEGVYARSSLDCRDSRLLCRQVYYS